MSSSAILHPLEQYLRRLQNDESGTSMLEFIIALPAFIIIFAGVLAIGQINSQAIVVESKAHIDAFSRARDVQTTGLVAGLSSGESIHMAPALAAAHATVQVEQYGPRQSGLVRGAIKAIEHSTYSLDGMVLSGHMGESRSRVQPLQLLGVRLYGVDGAVTANPEELFGQSRFARDILYDGPNAMFDAVQSIGNAEFSIQGILGALNSVITASGARGALAAGSRYGTVTGHNEDHLNVWRQDVDFNSHYTVTVAPYVHDNQWENAMRATGISRLTMVNPSYGVYTEGLGFHGHPKFNLEQTNKLEVPEHDELFTTPLDYEASLHD